MDESGRAYYVKEMFTSFLHGPFTVYIFFGGEMNGSKNSGRNKPLFCHIQEGRPSTWEHPMDQVYRELLGVIRKASATSATPSKTREEWLDRRSPSWEKDVWRCVDWNIGAKTTIVHVIILVIVKRGTVVLVLASTLHTTCRLGMQKKMTWPWSKSGLMPSVHKVGLWFTMIPYDSCIFTWFLYLSFVDWVCQFPGNNSRLPHSTPTTFSSSLGLIWKSMWCQLRSHW